MCAPNVDADKVFAFVQLGGTGVTDRLVKLCAYLVVHVCRLGELRDFACVRFGRLGLRAGRFGTRRRELAELADLVPVAGFGVVADLAWAVGLGVADGDGVGTGVGEAEDGVAAGLTPTVAAGGGLMSR